MSSQALKVLWTPMKGGEGLEGETANRLCSPIART